MGRLNTTTASLAAAETTLQAMRKPILERSISVGRGPEPRPTEPQTRILCSARYRRTTMGRRPDYDDSTDGGNESSTSTGDSIGWHQASQPPGEMLTRDVPPSRRSNESDF